MPDSPMASRASCTDWTMQESAVGLTAGVPFRYRGVSRENLPIPSPNVTVILPALAGCFCPEFKTGRYIVRIITGKFY